MNIKESHMNFLSKIKEHQIDARTSKCANYDGVWMLSLYVTSSNEYNDAWQLDLGSLYMSRDRYFGISSSNDPVCHDRSQMYKKEIVFLLKSIMTTMDCRVENISGLITPIIGYKGEVLYFDKQTIHNSKWHEIIVFVYQLFWYRTFSVLLLISAWKCQVKHLLSHCVESWAHSLNVYYCFDNHWK